MRPAASRIERRIIHVLVFPFVPVTAMSCVGTSFFSSFGVNWNRLRDITESARRESATK